MNLNEYFKVGYISKTHGLLGEVTVVFEPGAAIDYDNVQAFFVDKQNSAVPFFIESISVRDNKAFVKFEDIGTLEDASKLTGLSIYLSKEQRPPAPANEFYADDVIGFHVIEALAGELGPVIGIMDSGPNQLLIIEFNKKEVLIPVKGPFVTSIDWERKLLTVSLPDGLLDL